MTGHVATLVAVLCALACFNGAQAALGVGACPNKPQPMANFELSKYAGRWFETSAFGTLFEAAGTCTQINYTPNKDGGMDVRNVMLEKNTGLTLSIKGWAQQVLDGSNSGKLATTLSVAGTNRTLPVYVLGTDYENYAVAYSCVDLFLFHYELGWVFSRQAELGEKQEETVRDIITANGLDLEQYIPQVQDCGVIDF